MKILIVGLAKVKYMPYLNFYFDSLDKTRHIIHICFWNRDGKDEDLSMYIDSTFHEFIYRQQNSVSKLNKIFPFLRYRRFIFNLMEKEKFDFVIFLHSLTGVLIKKKLVKNQYIFDYRDSTFESNIFFKRIISNLVKNSYLTFVSSPGFLQFLPKSSKIHISHNLTNDSLFHRDYEREESEKIRIVFWGYIRNVSINIPLIEKISEDKRFELHFYGREQRDAERLKEYARLISAPNVFFHGEYNPRDRYDFVRKTDLLHNIYEDSNSQIAMGNKYYDGLIFRIPQLCLKGSFMGMMVTKSGIGLECDPRDINFLDNVYNYYTKICRRQVNESCDIEFDGIMAEYHAGQTLIRNIGTRYEN